MTPKQRAVAALSLQQPDDIVPTFELEFQLTEELFGVPWPLSSGWGLTGAEREKAVVDYAELQVRIAERLDYSIIRIYDLDVFRFLKKEGYGEKFLLCGEADGTMSIPDGSSMEDLACSLVEEPEEVHAKLAKDAAWAKDWGAQLAEAGAECVTMCADYCFNQGPFLSPKQFREFVFPYLADVIASHRANGLKVIKHTDGDINPILDQLVDANPHGLHSLDPQGHVDIAEVKRKYGQRICLCGNVNCGLLQTGTDEQVKESALYSLRHGMPGGGFIYCTSNVAFKGMELDRYLMILDIRQEYGRYDTPK